MNKVLSQAIKKAVSEFSPTTQENHLDKRPDLFSLNNETELFQNSKGITIKTDRTKDKNLTSFGKATCRRKLQVADARIGPILELSIKCPIPHCLT